MPYVQRDSTGKVTGRFANPQPGYAEEWLDDNAPDLQPTAQALALAQIASLEFEQTVKTTPRARREMDLGSILAIRAIGTIFQTLGAALNQPAVVNAALPLVHIGKVEDKVNPGTWIDTPGVKALIDIQTAIEQKRPLL